ncbi:MAG: hypothetical protein HS115_11260 [Spirochaetales bacterium]|nr:hypothetical protein [Spirochaetales bacterium]
MLTMKEITELDPEFQGAGLTVQSPSAPAAWKVLLPVILSDYPEISAVTLGLVLYRKKKSFSEKSWQGKELSVLALFYRGHIPADELAALELMLKRLLPSGPAGFEVLFQRLPVQGNTQASALSLRLLAKGTAVFSKAAARAA